MYSRILVPLDGSEAARAGLKEAIKLGRNSGASLRLLHVVNELVLTSPYAADMFDAGQYASAIVENLRRAGRALLDEAESEFRREGIGTDTKKEYVRCAVEYVLTANRSEALDRKSAAMANRCDAARGEASPAG